MPPEREVVAKRMKIEEKEKKKEEKKKLIVLNDDSTVQELYTVFGLDPVNVKHLPAKAVRIEGTEQITENT